MRLLLLLLLAGSAMASPSFEVLPAPSLPGAGAAGEPTIGIPWNTDSVFFMSGEAVFRIRFDDGPVWDDVTPLNSVRNLDPMLHADPETGRVWAGGLDGACSIMSFTDDDGETWVPTGNMCTGAQFDHQSIGSGPHFTLPEHPLYPHAAYYCAQLGTAACATSLDGGVSWGVPIQVVGACGGLHGHVRVSRITGTAAVPDSSCAGKVGFFFTQDDGLTWSSRVHPDATTPQETFDPSLQFGQGQGWLWLGSAGGSGAFIGLSKDEGASWEKIGLDDATWLDVGAMASPPVVRAHFADVQVGDDDRVAFSFVGLPERDPPYDDTGDCGADSDGVFWYYYIAVSYDAGTTWSVQRVSDDPVQAGSISTGGFQPAGDSSCRNLLEFNDMDIDSTGRIFVGFADGCTASCAAGDTGGDGFRSQHATLIRQTGGNGLFAAYDTPGTSAPTSSPAEGPDPRDTPGAPLALLLLALFVARRKQ